MLTRCPNCSTVFHVTMEQLEAAGGRVRCGHCQTVFNARDALLEQAGAGQGTPPSAARHIGAPQAQAPESADGAGHAPRYAYTTDYTSLLTRTAEPDPREQETKPPTPDVRKPVQPELELSPVEPGPAQVGAAANAAPKIAEAIEPPQTGEPGIPSLSGSRIDAEAGARYHRAANIPDILEEDLRALARPRTVWRPLAWIAAIIVLLGTLTLQYAYFMRAELAQREMWRPWITRLCSVAGCELPLRNNPKQIRWLSRDVMLGAAHNGRLIIRATVVNTAAYPQAFPTLQVKLSNLRGKVVAMRRFKPDEYLKPGTDIRRGLQPDTPVTLQLELLRPRQEVAGYELEFL